MSRSRRAALAVLAGLSLIGGACSPDAGAGPPVPAPSLGSAGIGPLSPVTVTAAAGTPADGRSLNLPAGWTAQVWAAVPKARLATWTPDGRLLVSTGDVGRVAVLTPGGAGRAPAVATLLDGLQNPQGLAFAGSVLVVGEATRLVAYDYAGGAVTNRRVIIEGLPGEGDGHGSKAVAVRDGVVYYSLGSATNRDPADRASDPERAVIAQVGLDGTGNRVVATGVRNGFGLDFAPDGTLFTAVNHADNQPYPFKDDTDRYGEEVPEFINENPVEQVSRVTPGTDLGWPHCLPDTRGSADLTQLPYVADPVNNPDGKALDCAAIGTTMVGLPAHSAPLGLTFTRGTGLPTALADGALITAHGSWNRRPPREPYVAYSAWDDAGKRLGAASALVTGFQNADGSRWGRSVDALPGPDGSLYVTDDAAGLVYRLTPPA